jgi:hypothetical protein
MTRGTSPEFLESVVKSTPLSRLGEPQEVAHAVVFLLSSKADFIRGTFSLLMAAVCFVYMCELHLRERPLHKSRLYADSTLFGHSWLFLRPIEATILFIVGNGFIDSTSKVKPTLSGDEQY